jgi:hypothetical protein
MWWLCDRKVRAIDSRAYAILNDGDRPVPNDVVEALRNYDVTPVLWSGREQVREDLAA